jgi:hypothetical protein
MALPVPTMTTASPPSGVSLSCIEFVAPVAPFEVTTAVKTESPIRTGAGTRSLPA